MNAEAINLNGAIITPACIDALQSFQEESNAGIADISTLFDRFTEILFDLQRGSGYEVSDTEAFDLLKQIHYAKKEIQNLSAPNQKNK